MKLAKPDEKRAKTGKKDICKLCCSSPDVPGPVLGCPDLLLPPDVEVDVSDGDPGPGGGLVVQCARAALKHPGPDM